MDLKRVERLLQRITDIQKAENYSLYMAIVLPSWGIDIDGDEHDGQWCCSLTIGKPKGYTDWEETQMLPAQWFDTQEEAMAAAQAAAADYPASKRKNGKMAEPLYVVLDDDEATA